MDELSFETQSLRNGQEKMKQAFRYVDSEYIKKSEKEDSLNSFNDLSKYKQQNQYQHDNGESIFKQEFMDQNLQDNKIADLSHNQIQDIQNSYIKLIDTTLKTQNFNDIQAFQETRLKSISLELQKEHQPFNDNLNKTLLNSEQQIQKQQYVSTINKCETLMKIAEEEEKGTQNNSQKITSLQQIHQQQSVETSQQRQSKSNILKVMAIVRIFIGKLKKESKNILFKRISQEQFDLIGDNSAKYEYYIQNKNIIQQTQIL